jgi:DNA polymerase-3 subunit epsilon
MTSQLDMFSGSSQAPRRPSSPTGRIRHVGSAPDEAEIIEIGLIGFTFNDEGEIGDVTGVYGGLQQPTISIPMEVTRLTGITDAMVLDQTIDMPRVRALIEPANLIIAYNASFDRPFCEVLSAIFSAKAWACSNSEIDWTARGYEGTKLGYLINQSGYFHVGHRAVDDCFALLEVLALTRGDTEPPLPSYTKQASVRACAFSRKMHLSISRTCSRQGAIAGLMAATGVRNHGGSRSPKRPWTTSFGSCEPRSTAGRMTIRQFSG